LRCCLHHPHVRFNHKETEQTKSAKEEEYLIEVFTCEKEGKVEGGEEISPSSPPSP